MDPHALGGEVHEQSSSFFLFRPLYDVFHLRYAHHMEKPESLDGHVERCRQEILPVYRIRHGETEYKEHFTHSQEVVNDLTEEGRENITQAANAVADELNPDTDIVYILCSPRQRTIDSAQIVADVLQKRGFELQSSLDDRSKRGELLGTNIVDSNGEVVPPQTPEHAATFKELTQMDDLHRKYLGGKITELEDPNEVRGRSKKHLALLIRMAHRVQAPTGKRYVVVQTEHEETLDELISQASGGERSMATQNGVERGDVIRMDIPLAADMSAQRKVVIPTTVVRGAPLPPSAAITFNYLKRDFKS